MFASGTGGPNAAPSIENATVPVGVGKGAGSFVISSMKGLLRGNEVTAPAGEKRALENGAVAGLLRTSCMLPVGAAGETKAWKEPSYSLPIRKYLAVP